MSQVAAGLRQPVDSSAPRVPGSVRRTTHVDMRTDPDDLDRLTLSSAARDLVTRDGGRPEEVGAAAVSAEVGRGRALTSLRTTPHLAAADRLVGRPVASGFRALVDEALPGERSAHSLLYRLLEELPVAALIAGYADLYLDRVPATAVRRRTEGGALPADICAGWRHDGSMMTAIDRTGAIPIPVGPPAPPLDADDRAAWHEMPPLGAGTMRRRRLVDVAPAGDTVVVSAMFRDSHVEGAGLETVLHQYDVAAVVDRGSRVVRSCVATPRVLPWVECPSAAASAGRLAGHPVADIRALVRLDLRGTSTCTHLNDLLRSLGDVGALLDLLGA